MKYLLICSHSNLCFLWENIPLLLLGLKLVLCVQNNIPVHVMGLFVLWNFIENLIISWALYAYVYDENFVAVATN